ncbi:MAG: hypothetical protein L3J56_06960 [Bacteroidales bacterium]|nr:hypothetical protein [Bacteroidales bacterium]
MNKKIKIQDKQTLFDVAVKYFGNTDAVFEIISKNNIDFSLKLSAGQSLDLSNIAIIRNDLTIYFQNKEPATDVESNEFSAGFSLGFSLGFNS